MLKGPKELQTTIWALNVISNNAGSYLTTEKNQKFPSKHNFKHV